MRSVFLPTAPAGAVAAFELAGGGLLSLLALENLHSHVVDRGIVENNNAAVGARFDMDTTVLAEIVVRSPPFFLLFT